MRRQAGVSVVVWFLAPFALAAACGDDGAPPPVASSGAAQSGRAGSQGFGATSGAAGGADGGGALAVTGGGGVDSAEAGAGPAGARSTATCNSGKGAVITGRVLSPSGELPVAGAAVYVASTTLDELPDGVGCWRCSSALTGTPIALGVTDAAGRFEIDNAPVGDSIQLVVQTGKWQRKLKLPVVDCQDNPAPEAETRLPRKQSEGHLPAIALVSGAEDTLECLLRKLGVDDSEFTASPSGGRVRLFAGKGGMARLADGGDALPPVTSLWSTPEQISNFDLVLLGSEADQNAAAKPREALATVHDYAALGGRVLVQRSQNYFLSASSADVSQLLTFVTAAQLPDPSTLKVDEGSARGRALADSLQATERQSVRGELTLKDGRRSVTGVAAPGLKLLYGDAPSSVQAFSLDLPVAGVEPSCGRITATELSTAAADKIADFPNGCSSKGLNAQERALAYLIFDLGACLP